MPLLSKINCMLLFYLAVVCLLVPSTDNLCKKFGARSCPTKCRARSGSKLFDTLIAFLKTKSFEKLILKEKLSGNDLLPRHFISHGGTPLIGE